MPLLGTVSMRALITALASVLASNVRSMTKEPGYNLNRAISSAHTLWDSNYQYHGAKSPWHHVISQLLTVIPDEEAAVHYVDLIIENALEADTLTLDMVIFTEKLVLRSLRSAGEIPTLRVIPRSRLSDLRIVSVPIATFRQTGAAWTPYSVQLTYSSEKLTLPRDEKNRELSDGIGRLLPSLISELQPTE